MKKKNEVFVRINTPKKAKKVKKVLDMFGEETYEKTYERLANGLVSSEYPLINFNYEWVGDTGYIKNDKTEVSIKELRNILAIEHLKEGDVVVTKTGSEKIIAVYDYACKSDLTLFQAKRWVRVSDGFKWNNEGCFNTFLRYATEEEKALLNDEPKSIEAGKWYTFAWDDSTNDIIGIYFIEKVEGIKVWFSYGIDFIENEWQSKDWYNSSYVWKEATKEKVEQALIKEAKKRYKVGDYYIFLEMENMLFNESADRYVFDNGKWAEIVEPSFDGENIGKIVRVIDGGEWARGANGKIGVLVDKSTVATCGFHGATVKVQTDDGKVWGLNSLYHEIEYITESSPMTVTIEIKDIATLQVIQKTLKELEEKLTKLI